MFQWLKNIVDSFKPAKQACCPNCGSYNVAIRSNITGRGIERGYIYAQCKNCKVISAPFESYDSVRDYWGDIVIEPSQNKVVKIEVFETRRIP